MYKDVVKIFFAKRGFLSVSRNLGKTVLLFSLLFLLSTLSIGGLLVRNAIYSTSEQVLLQIPRLTLPRWDYMREGDVEDVEDFEFPTIGMLEEIGNLSEVFAFDIANGGQIEIDGFEFYVPEFDPNLLPERGSIPNIDILSQNSIFGTRGIGSITPFDLYAGLIELVEGRFMTEAEIADGAYVAVFPKSLAELNNVGIGSHIGLIYRVPYRWEGFTEIGHREKIITVEIIGLFDPVLKEIYYDPYGDILYEQMRLANQIYLPAEINLQFSSFRLEHFTGPNGESMMDSIDPGWMAAGNRGFFILHDMREWEAFEEKANEILPEFWFMDNLSTNFRHLISATNTVMGIANLVVIGSSVAIVVILALVIVLFLNDRKRELGIYLALGEKRKMIVMQVLMEVGLISILAIFFALFSAQMLSREVSTVMLRNNILSVQDEETSRHVLEGIPGDLLLFNPGEMAVDDMMEMYEVYLSLPTVALFFIVKLGVVGISTILPIAFILRLNPKEALLN